MTFDIHGVMQGLAESRPIFHSEADFQFALAWRIKEMMPGCEVRLEYKPFNDEAFFLDVWLPTMRMALELKYIRGRVDLEHGGERFSLKEGASDIERYDFLKDIQRLERMISERGNVDRGCAVLLANSSSCWKQPIANRKTTIFEAFRIHEGRQIRAKEELAWAVGSKPGREREVPLRFANSYKMRWQDYHDFGERGHSRFRYLAISVGD